MQAAHPRRMIDLYMDENESDAASGMEEDAVMPDGLIYSDDEAYLFEVYPESEDET